MTQYDRLSILQGGYSSLHFHRKKFNQFVVESGELLIYQLQPFESPYFVKHQLAPGDHLVIEPGAKTIHQFFAPESCVLHEFYWQADSLEEIEREEIVRLTENGRGDFEPPIWTKYQEQIEKIWGM